MIQKASSHCSQEINKDEIERIRAESQNQERRQFLGSSKSVNSMEDSKSLTSTHLNLLPGLDN